MILAWACPFKKIQKSRKTRKWVGGLKPQHGFFSFFWKFCVFLVFCVLLFFVVQVFKRNEKNWIGVGWVASGQSEFSRMDFWTFL